MYQAAGAAAAAAKGADLFTIDLVISPEMQALCTRLGMTPTPNGGFQGVPATVIRAAATYARGKGWDLPGVE
ncbi:hypothetical protein HLB44_36315 [Aquincola sp. S2]|uniref:Uncharacterized protein n=1 Tax=Pseudaquabacterium terrae TaxID=2732868 RepID=A0ABX2EV11_9BURK|nr:hypothetical protein [Aquabacterium terrae]NRF72428.1 hypothetical protein [Aquabacterium terrae]